MNYFSELNKFFESVLYQYKINNIVKKLSSTNEGIEKINTFVINVSIDTIESACNSFIEGNLNNIDYGVADNVLLDFLAFWEKKHNLWHIYGNDLRNYFPYYYILIDSLLNNSSIISLFQNNTSFEEIDRTVFNNKGMGYIRLLHSTPLEERHTKLSPECLFSADYYKPSYFLFIDALHLYSYSEGCKIVEKLIEDKKPLLSKNEKKDNYSFYQKSEGILNKIKELFEKDNSDYIFNMSLCKEELDKNINNCLVLCEFMYDAFIIPNELSNKYKSKLYSM